MEVTSIADLGNRAGWTLSGGRSYTAELKVETDDVRVGAKAVIDALNLFADTAYRWPLTSAATETDPRCLLTDVDASPSGGDGRQWRVTLKFDPRSWEGDPRGPVAEDGSRDPFAAVPVLRGSGEEEEFGLAYDRAGEPILNSCGEPFEQAPSIPIPVVVYEVSRLERFFDESLIPNVQGRVNSAAWLGWPPGSVLCKLITATRTWVADAGGWGWDVVYRFAVKRSQVALGPSGVKIRPGWRLQLLDAGYHEKDGANPPKAILDKHGVPVSSPAPLDGNGQRLAEDATPVYREFDVFPTADFAALNLPEDLFSAGTAAPPP